MAKCDKCGKACMCGVRKKRKVMVRRAPPARVFKGTTATAPGVDIASIVRLVSDLTSKRAEQPIIPPAATIGIPEAAKNIKPMVSSTSGTLQSSIGTETTPNLRTYGTQTFGMGVAPRIKAPAGISVGTETIKQRATPYKSGFLSILPEAQKAKAIGERAIEASTPGIIQRATPAISEQALASKVFTQTTKGKGTETFNIAQLEQRLAEGDILRPRGGGLTREQLQARQLAVAQEAAGQPQP